jgi:hypothetical protein
MKFKEIGWFSKNISMGPETESWANYLRSKFPHVRHATSYQSFIYIIIMKN